jgi:hypothetical protein
MQCIANGNTRQTSKLGNWRKETMVRDQKIKSLEKELADIQKRMLALIEYAKSNDVNLPNSLSIVKPVNISSIERPRGMHISEWIAKQDKIIESLEKDLLTVKKPMFMLMHYISSKGIKIPEHARIAVPKPPPYINPDWQEDYSMGAVADVYKIKIFQKQKADRTLVEVQYKAEMREVLLGWVDISPYKSLPQTKMVAINRNTPKDIKFWGGWQRDNIRVSDGDYIPGKWTIMQFRGFDLTQYTDGQEVELDMRCIIVDSIRYQTAIGGTNTVFVAEPFRVK